MSQFNSCAKPSRQAPSLHLKQAKRHTAVVNSGHHWDCTSVYQVDAQSQADTMQLIAPLLKQLSLQKRWLVLIAPPKSVLQAIRMHAGIDQRRILVVHQRDDFAALWALEQALVSGTGSCVLTWIEQANPRDLQRLKWLARRGQSLSFIFTSNHICQHSAARIMAHRHRQETHELPPETLNNSNLTAAMAVH